MATKTINGIRKAAKWLGKILLSLLLFLAVVLLLLQTQFGKNMVRQQAVKYLSSKLNTKVDIAGIEVKWFTHLVLTGIYVEDLSKQPLAKIQGLDVSYDVTEIFSNKLTISDIKLNTPSITFRRTASDSNFNYQFIIDAFASETDTTIKGKKVLDVVLKTVAIRQLHFEMDDKYGAQYLITDVDSISANIKKMNIEKMAFEVKYLLVDAANISSRMGDKKNILLPNVPNENNANTESPNFSIVVDSVLFKTPRFIMQDSVSLLDVNTTALSLGASDVQFDLTKMHATLHTISLINNDTKIAYKSSTDNESSTAVNSDSTAPFTFSAGIFTIQNTRIIVDDLAAKRLGARQVDFGHLGIDALNVNASQINYDGKVYNADIQRLSANEKSGFILNNFAGNGHYSDTGFALSGFSLITDRNNIKGNIAASYASIASMTSKPQQTFVNAQLYQTRLQLDELLYFNPALANNASIKPLLNKTFLLTTSVFGPLNNLNIPNLILKVSNTNLQASATIRNLPDIDKLVVDLHLKQLSGNRNELLALLPKGTIPDSLLHYIPQTFSLSGTYKGTLKAFTTNLQLKSSEGDAAIIGSLKNITDAKNAIYDLAINGENIQLGHLLSDTSLGIFTGKVKLKGKGFALATTSAAYEANVSKAYFRGYTYQNVFAEGTLANNTIIAQLNSNDPNAQLDAIVNYDMHAKKGSLNTTANIYKIDFKKLGFTSESIIFAGNIKADIPVLDTTQLTGDIMLTQMNLNLGSQKYLMDSIIVNARYVNDSQFIKLTTPIVDASLNGHYTLQSIPAAITVISNRYFFPNKSDTFFTKHLDASLNAAVHLPDSLLPLVKGLTKLSPFNVNASINTDSSSINFITKIPLIDYQGIKLDSVTIMAVHQEGFSNRRGLLFGLTIGRTESSSFYLNNSILGGNVSEGILDAGIVLKDDDNSTRYVIPFIINNNAERPFLKFKDSVMLDKRGWKVNDENKVYLNFNELFGTNLTLSNGNETLAIGTGGSVGQGLPINLTLQQFKLRNITDIFQSDTTLADGYANGSFSIQSIAPFNFTTDLHLDSLVLKGINAGNLTARATMQNDSSIAVDVNLLGMNNDVKVIGTYAPKSDFIDLHLDMKQFDISNVQPFVAEYVDKLKGKIKGDLILKGSLTKPDIIGTIGTDSASLIYKDFGTYISMPAENIRITSEAMIFDNFHFYDSANRQGTLNGVITLSENSSADLNFKINTNGMQLIGYKMYPKQYMQGPAFVDANLTLKGNTELMQVDGSVNVKDSSKITYIYTENDMLQQGQGLIEFFDPLHPVDSSKNSTKKAKRRSTELAMNIYSKISPSSEVTIVLDEINGDKLQIKGNAGLNFTMSPGGKLSLTGSYTVESGFYDLSIAQVIKKQFVIQKGSTIIWNGDPLKADMNITALYKIRTTAGELVTDIQAVPGIDKQLLNFEIYLYLTKQLLRPDINFKIDMPIKDQQVFNGVVYTRLKQVNNIPAELNKQVMGLLAINHFIADNPFNSLNTGGSNFETTAISTAGRLLTQELTNLAAKMVKGVDINFALDVNEDYSSGQAQRSTDLKVGLAKSLANNRLKIYVGSSIALESSQQSADLLEGLVGDVTLEYLLSTDGKYRLKGFRVNEHELTFDGTIVKTGVTFSMVLEFNKFKNAFKTNRAKNKKN